MKREVLNNHFRMLQSLQNAQELQRTMMARVEKEKGNTKLLTVLIEALADVKRSISYFEKQIAESSPDVVTFINSVKDPRIRQMLRLWYLHGLAWCEIPDYFGPGISEAGCRVACARYLRAHCK